MKNTPIDVVLNPFPTIANGIVAPTVYTTELPASYDYWELTLNLLGGLTVAMIEEIRLKANGTLIQQVTGPDLDAMAQFYKAPAAAAIAGQILLVLDQRRLGIRGGVQGLAEGKLLSGSAKDLALESTLNCGSFDEQGRGIKALTMEIVVNNTPGAGTLRVEVYGSATDPYPGGAGLIPVLTRNTFNASTGINVMSKSNAFLMGDVMHAMLDAVHLVPFAGQTLDDFYLWFNNNLILSRSDARNRFLQQRDALRVPQAGLYSFDFTADGFGDQALGIAPTATELRMQLTASGAAGNITVYQKSLGRLFA